MGVGKISEAQKDKIDSLALTKVKVDSFGRTYSEDANGNILNGSLVLKDGNILASKEFVAFYAYKTGIKDKIYGFYKKSLKEDIIKEDEFFSYKLLDEKNIPVISITFRFSKKNGWFSKNYKLEVDAILSIKDFNQEQVDSIKSLLNASRHLLLKDPVLKKTSCTIAIRTNV